MKQHSYPVELHWSAVDEGRIATFPDFPGCSAWGATEVEARAESHTAVAAWLKACKAAGNPIPEPSALPDEADYSGRFVMHIPKRLHADLAKAAKRYDASLNQYALYPLAARAAVSGKARA